MVLCLVLSVVLIINYFKNKKHWKGVINMVTREEFKENLLALLDIINNNN